MALRDTWTLLRGIRRRMQLADKAIRYVYVDDCCQSRAHYESALGLASASVYSTNLYKQSTYELINDIRDVKGAVKKIIAELERGFPDAQESNSPKFLGFDVENTTALANGRKPGRGTPENGPVAILQLATPQQAYLFRVCNFGTALPDDLLALLKNPNVFKVGVGIDADVTNLKKKFSNAHVESAVDTRVLAREKLGHAGGLEALCLELGIGQLLKSDELRLYTDWEATHLTSEQLIYAATDATASLELHSTLYAMADNIGTSLNKMYESKINKLDDDFRASSPGMNPNSLFMSELGNKGWEAAQTGTHFKFCERRYHK